jgi:hypothetical protein
MRVVAERCVLPCVVLQATVTLRTQEFQSGRDHIVMVPGVLDLSPVSSSWPPSGGLTINLPASIIGTTNQSEVVCGFAQPLLVLPDNASAGHLQIRQLQLTGLPQGPAGAEQQDERGRHRRLMAEGAGSSEASEWTMLLWFIQR